MDKNTKLTIGNSETELSGSLVTINEAGRLIKAIEVNPNDAYNQFQIINAKLKSAA